MIVLGKPGSGKTTFLKYLTLLALDGKLEAKKIPIYINMKEWDDSGKELLPFIVDRFDQYGAPDAQSFIERLLKDDECLLLLDGFDEVDHIDKSIGEVEKFIRKYSGNQYVLSCRTASWKADLQHFTTVEMADFNEDQIKMFIKQWFGEKDKKTGQDCWDELKDDEPVKELARTPLLLAMLCIAYNKRLKFPTKRSDLYKMAVNTLILEWDVSRKIKRKEIVKELTPQRKERLLSILAAKTFVDNKYFFYEEMAAGEIEAYLKKLLDIDPARLTVDCRDILESLEERHGLVVKRAIEIYSFSHKSIQEFLTAVYIYDNRGQGSLKRLIDTHVLNEGWREVFLLLSGLLNENDANDFFIEFRKRIALFADRKIISFLKKIDKTIRPQPGFPKGINRLFAIMAIAKDEDFNQLFERINKKAVDVDGAFIEFPPQKIAFPPSMNDYAKAAKLFLECLMSESDVPRNVKKQLLDGLFLEPWEYKNDEKEKSTAAYRREEKEEESDNIQTILLDLPEGAVPMQFVCIPPGTFTIGEGKDRHPITISQEFYLGKYPVTQAQWEAVMGENPSHFSGNPNHPVECVSWNDCQRFLDKINRKGLGKFRLPSEAEWEYACRANTDTFYFWGNDPDGKEIWNYAWFCDNSLQQTHAVGKRHKNPWDLYDMNGNVWEWCEDDWHDKFKEAPKDGRPWIDSPRDSLRVLRGGCWDVESMICRSALRGRFYPADRDYIIGFRVVFSRT